MIFIYVHTKIRTIFARFSWSSFKQISFDHTQQYIIKGSDLYNL